MVRSTNLLEVPAMQSHVAVEGRYVFEFSMAQIAFDWFGFGFAICLGRDGRGGTRRRRARSGRSGRGAGRFVRLIGGCNVCFESCTLLRLEINVGADHYQFINAK